MSGLALPCNRVSQADVGPMVTESDHDPEFGKSSTQTDPKGHYEVHLETIALLQGPEAPVRRVRYVTVDAGPQLQAGALRGVEEAKS